MSDIASVLQCGHTPVFVDIAPHNLAMDADQVLDRITPKTKAVFLTHVLGFNGLSDKLLEGLKSRGIPLIEDTCESHGATFRGRRLGSYGLVSNFSFFYGHHMSTIEGGIVSTDDEDLHETVRALRSHGMARELKSAERKARIAAEHPDLNPDFIFLHPAYNMRSTELNAVLGLSQLRRLDENNRRRVRNFKLFLDNLDASKYRVDFDLAGAVNYGFILILREPDEKRRDAVMRALREANVEFRRGLSGGGNQLRQPYLKGIVPEGEHRNYPRVEHVHFFGFYLGNYPSLPEEKILSLCALLNRV